MLKSPVFWGFFVVVAVAVLLLIWLFSPKDRVEGGVFNRPGNYSLDDGEKNLVISDINDIVCLKLVSNDVVVIDSVNDISPSSHSRWGVFVDDRSGVVWIYSGDIGLFAWVPDTIDGSKSYQFNTVDDNSGLLRSMPSEVWAILPNVLQQRWAQYRNLQGPGQIESGHPTDQE